MTAAIRVLVVEDDALLADAHRELVGRDLRERRLVQRFPVVC